MRIQEIIETLEELSKYLEMEDCSMRFVVAVDESVRIMKNVEKSVEGVKAYDELRKGV